jgi:MFS family permease
MKKKEEHLRKTAQIWRAGGMIWLIAVTLFFAAYDLYFLNLSLLLSIGLGVVAFTITFILFAWSLRTLRLAKRLPEEERIDEIKRRKIQKGFLIVLIIEILTFNIAPFALLYFNHIEYIVLVEILICALHFLPLARIFMMPVYYILGSFVSVITVLTILLVPASPLIGNLAVIAAIPSLCFIVSNWVVITYILNDAMKYLTKQDINTIYSPL